MAEILLIIFFIVYIKYMDHLTDRRVDNYDLSRVDTHKMCSDGYMNNLSGRQVQKNMIAGKYDKK